MVAMMVASKAALLAVLTAERKVANKDLMDLMKVERKVE